MYRRSATALLILLLVGCGGSATSTSRTATSAVVTSVAVQSTATTTAVTSPTPADTPTPSPTPQPTATPTPAATPTPDHVAPTVIASGFGVEDGIAGYAFIVNNPNAGYAIENSQLQVALYDDAGNAIGTDSGTIGLILPGAKRPVSGVITVPDGETPTKLDVQFLPGEYVATTAANVLTTSNVKYFGGVVPKVTGVVKNASSKDLQQILAIVIAYDSQGKIIGSGRTLLAFVPANGQTAVEMYPSVSGTPDHLDMYATVSATADFP